MSAPGFTPGPWSVCQHLKSVKDDAACSCGYRGVVFGPEHGVEMAICQPGHDRPQREEEWGTEPLRYPREVEIANAHLIAAAPDLYGALIEAKRELWTAARDHWTLADFKNWATVQQIDAALAKARGQ